MFLGLPPSVATYKVACISGYILYQGNELLLLKIEKSKSKYIIQWKKTEAMTSTKQYVIMWLCIFPRECASDSCISLVPALTPFTGSSGLSKKRWKEILNFSQSWDMEALGENQGRIAARKGLEVNIMCMGTQQWRKCFFQDICSSSFFSTLTV